MRATINQWTALARAALIIVGTVAAVSGVTFAALQSQAAVVKGSTIETANASLQVSDDNITYANSVSGYAFGGLIPGGQAMPANGNTVYVKNTGTTPESVYLSIPAGFTNPGNIDLSKVHLILNPILGGAGQNITLQDLVNTSGGVLITTASAAHLGLNFYAALNVKVSIDPDAAINASAVISNLDLDFTGVAVS